MKNIAIYFVFLFSFIVCRGQVAEPVRWQARAEKLSETEYNLIFNASIEPHWHLYSQNLPEGGALPTVFTFENAGEDFELVGETKESEPVTEHDPVFDMELSFFDMKATFTQKIKLLKPDINAVRAHVEFQACDDKSCIFSDAGLAFSLDGGKAEIKQLEVDEKSAMLSEKLKLDLKNQGLLKGEDQGQGGGNSLAGIFILGFLGGLLALLTPCVFPMIPLTVSFFTKQSGTRKKGISNAVLYGVFIVVIYMLLSIPFHFLDSIDPEILNTISTNVWLNIAFFVIFVFFAFSFFGYYELTLPSSWGNKMDSASGTGGVIGIFFMALTLAIVSFSCTGPILGSLLVGSLTAEGGAAQLTAGITGFGFALALPFGLFALFPNWLNSLPRSGGWMTTVKVMLGFLELALAFKFLSNADLVQHWGILKREIFIGIWIVIFALMAFYLFGKIKFPHDGPLKKLGFIRMASGVLVTAFVIYLIPGIWGANLKLLSGFPPPMFYSVKQQESDCPLGLNCFKDFDEGLEYAKAHNKPILLDFTGWACVNCRKMEENVWSVPKVYEQLRDNYVLISLYVDDRKELPENKQFNYQLESGRVKKIRTIGEKWATFQAINFHTASQPYYIIITPDMELLGPSQQYTDAETYYDWLKKGTTAVK
ncbi:thioredoxin family protein [Sinomicrobium kalidii]|uniref:protein-disulfide reductase DsbD family protein n=1 Tax=Sinomicrobium kalidii TaxID=2900738 RepID=UPI001E5FAD84|nr:cytochrome c biogenesis protein CcdA [Sinomicrobium kalidii]UGU14732.1 thioredoxin family protein [Sinomicrobium kalidii]